MSNPTPILNNINAFDATKGTTISFNIIGGTEIVRSNIVYIYDLSTNDLICTHLYISTESIHELPPNTDPSIVYASGKSSADFVNNKNYYLQIQTFTNTAGTAGGSGMSVAKTFWCLFNPALSVNAIPAAVSTTSYNVGATYTTNITDATIPVTNIIQQYKFDLYTATGTLVQTSGNIIGSGEQEGTSTTYNITYNFSGLMVNNSYYVVVTTTSTEGMTVSAQSNTFTVSIDTPTVGAATATNNSCDGYISVVSNLSDEYGGSASGEMASFETDSVNNVSSLKVNMEPIQEGSGTPSPTNIRPIRGHSGVNAYVSPTQSADDGTKYSQEFDVSLTPTSTDKVPYTFKAVGRDVYGDREYLDSIIGGTVAWNQLAEIVGYQSPLNGVTFTINSDGSVTVNGTASSNARWSGFKAPAISGHVYYSQGCPSGGSNSTYRLYSSYMGDTLDRGSGRVVKNTNSTSYPDATGEIFISSGYTANNLVFKPQYIDLTAMFGSTIADYIYSLEQATAGAGVAWFRHYFPNDYYPYDPGTLRSVEGVSAHEMVGFNQWDEEWEVGLLNPDGTASATGNRTVSKNYVPVVAGTTYYMSWNGDGSTGRGAFYDDDFNCISYYADFPLSAQLIEDSRYGSIITIPSGASYMKFCMSTSYGTTYNSDICINISDPSRNGEYEPYVKHTYALDSDLTLRGIPKLDASNNLYYDGDTYESDGTVTRRYGIVDLGTLNWGYSGGFFRTAGLNGLVKRPTTNANKVTAISDGYEVMTWNSITNTSNKCFAVSSGSDNAIFCNTAYTDATAFKAAMSGVYLLYELATPTTETAEPYQEVQICSPYGTEEYVTTGIVPVGHETTYLTRDIFGGTLDLATGVLTVDRKMVDMETLSFNYDTGGKRWQILLPDIVDYPTRNGNLVAEKYAADITAATGDEGKMFTVGKGLYIYSTDGTNPPSGNLVYPLATPQTYQLTPHQIQTLVGTNNVWSDAGEVDVTFNLPISNLLVKRQDASDVSGNWLTLYSQPITQASDMDFTYIDFLNQYGKTYRYALVPLLTQQQGDIDVEIEGGYTVSDDVLSVFDGVFVANSNGSQKLKAATEYGDLETNQDVGVLTTIGNKYPFVVSNSNLNYHSGSISALIVPSDFYTSGDLGRLDIVERREAIEKFLTDKTAKILKDWNGNIWLITFVENVEVSFVDDYGMGLGTLSAKWVEIGDVNDQTDLQQTGLI